MSFFMAGGELARTIGPLVVVGAISLFGLKNYYPIMIMGLLASGWLLIKFSDIPIHRSTKENVSILGTWKEMRHVLRPLIIIMFTRGFMHSSLATFLPTFIRQETGNLWLAGFALTALEATGVVGVLTAGPLSDRMGRKQTLLISLICLPLSQ